MLLFTKLINDLSSLFTKVIINTIDYPIPTNIKNVHNLKLAIDYLKSINNYYTFIIGNLNNDNLYIHICSLLLDIIKNHSINEIELICEFVWNDITQLIFIKPFKDKNNYLTKISHEIINMITEEYKTPSDYKVINILKFIFNQNTNLFINEKVVLLFKNNNILLNFISSITDCINTQNLKMVKVIKNIICRIQNKDTIQCIIDKYNESFIKRVLNYLNIKDIHTLIKYITFEKCFIEDNKMIFDKKSIYKLHKIIDDVEKCINIQIDDKLMVLNISYDVWDIDISTGIIKDDFLNILPNSSLSYYLIQYSRTFYDNNSTKSFNWFLHYGEVDITYLDKNIILLPIQFIILEMFSPKKEIKYNEIFNHKILSNYSDKFKHNIIKSLINSKLLIKHDDTITLTSIPDFNTNLIELYFSNTEVITNTIKPFTFSINEIIYSNINKILKTKSMSFDELYEVCTKSITLFKINKEDFVHAIDYLIKNDYIINEKDIYTKLLY
jgi:hypothetical protein